jgi:formate dehydrogenase iron-sulfur subunit
MLALAHKRISDRPDKYVDHVYGEKELGGTSVVYLSAVPFEKLGFPAYGEKPFPALTQAALGAVPPAVMAVGALLGAAYAFFRKRVQAVADHGHVEFEPLTNKLMTPFNWVLLLLMAYGGVSLVARFALGLGGSTHLSNTYPWGLWILFDLVWIAVAAGAFAMAAVIYVFQRKDLYGLGRTAVLMGLLSYSFVTVTLVADLGLPWHFYALALNAPEHSAMFEVSWCVGLYVTILLLEFLPVPLEHWGFQPIVAAWRRWNGAYVAAAVTLFIYLMSRNVLYAAATAVIFGALAWMFRARDERAEPIMLAIAAVTLSTMHQSSLGSLYLLMPNMLAPQWWSPTMPVSFFLSSIAAGTALVILIDMWIAKAWRRPLEIARLASVGQIAFWALLVYLVFRLGDMAIRGQLSGAFAGRLGLAFAAEVLLGGVLPLILLARKSLRRRADVLCVASLLAVTGVAYNRMNVVLFAMTFRGRMPWGAPESYLPSIVEWGVSIGLIAATIFLFGLAARLMPVLSKAQPAESH